MKCFRIMFFLVVLFMSCTSLAEKAGFYMEKEMVLSGHMGAVLDVAFHPSRNIVASVGHDNRLILWNPDSGEIVKQIEAHGDSVLSLAFSPDGSRIVTGGADSYVKVWDSEDLSLLATLKGHKDKVYDVAFSDSGEVIASCGLDIGIRLWAADSFGLIEVLTGHKEPIQQIMFINEDQELLSCASDGTIKRWDLSQFLYLKNYELKGREVLSFSYDGDLEVIYCGDNRGTFYLWEKNNKSPAVELISHPPISETMAPDIKVWGVMIHPSDRFIGSIGTDKRLLFYTKKDLKQILKIKFKTIPWSIAFNTRGDRLAVALNDHTIALYTIDVN